MSKVQDYRTPAEVEPYTPPKQKTRAQLEWEQADYVDKVGICLVTGFMRALLSRLHCLDGPLVRAHGR